MPKDKPDIIVLETNLEMKEWRDIPRKNTKLAIVGFAPSTRDLTPWDDQTFDIWTVNEEYNFDWVKRHPDIHFQMHPRWDWERANNINHFNHPLWMKNKEDKCIRCKGERGWDVTNTDTKEVTWQTCNECEGKGIYTPPAWRSTIPIIMQEHHNDVLNSVPFPLKEATNLLPLDGYAYFTSSVAYMLTLAYLMGYQEINLYGFEMGTKTEYHYQKANFEYLVGLLQGYGIKIMVPPKSTLLKGELYGYKNMKTGFRQNLEMRKQFLEVQEVMQRDTYLKQTGQVECVQQLVQSGHPELVDILNDLMPLYAKTIGVHNVIKGALAEIKNLTDLYDSYFQGNNGEEGHMTAEEFNQYLNASYTQSN